ncbi:MAG: hypothetical protein QGF00_15585 [Planctomycetota bacterium]|nr:hypothetical protein [Planctomycetota bacterium]
MTDRNIRRAALLLFPGHSLNEAALDRIAEEGFQEVGAGVAITPFNREQGFSLKQGEQLAEMCRARGLGFVAFTGYMKYQYDLIDREPHRVMILGGDGNVRDLDGLSVRWLCPFRPENKELYNTLLSKICEWPAICEIHLNDEASIGMSPNNIGCYCEFCRKVFLSETGHEPPAAADWESPLWYDWIESRFRNWVEVHSEFREAIRLIRPDIRVGIQHSPYVPERIRNAWIAGVRLGSDAKALDMIATDPYHYNHHDGIKHRPHRRILSETTRSLVGACVKRRATIYPQGFMPPSQAVPMSKQDGIAAAVLPFALGADTTMPFTYELMKIIPGFFEGFQECRKLDTEFRSHEPYAFATMLCPQQSEIYGHYDSDWGSTHLRDMTELLYRTGTPWRWFWDERLDDADLPCGPLILPDVHCLSESQMERIEAVAQRHEGILRIGNLVHQPWKGSGACPAPHETTRGMFEVTEETEHPIFEGLDAPIIFSSRLDWDGPNGEVLGTIEGRPAIVLNDKNGRRGIWLTGKPAVDYFGTVPGSWSTVPTSNLELVRHLLSWAAGGRSPLIRLDPFPPVDAYRSLRPSDRRSVPTLELLPLIRREKNSDVESLLAVLFPYTPVACQTCIQINLPEGKRIARVTELWNEEDWTDRAVPDNRVMVIPLDLPADFELLVLKIEVERNP